jgi:antitoxin PrlF
MPICNANRLIALGAGMAESTITVKGQTTLPKAVRQALDLKPGDRLRYVILDGGEVRLLRGVPAIGLAGLLADAVARPVSLDEMDAAIAEGAAEGSSPG